jgi:curli biogenesis system outer membrane secretion channel CsgG
MNMRLFQFLAPILALVMATSAVAQSVCTSCQTVAVVDIQSDRDCRMYESDWGTVVVLQCQRKFREIRDMVETALRKTNKYAIYERERLYTIANERELAAVGITNGMGFKARLTGVDFLVYGKITEFSTGSSTVSTRGYTESADDAALAIDLKIVNVRTGRVVYSGDVRETLVTAQQYDGASVSTQSSMDGARTAGLLQRAVAIGIAREIATAGYPMVVADADPDGREIVINYGSPLLAKGMQVNVYSVGRIITDPVTGAVIERKMNEAGRYRITLVTPNSATAVRVEGGGRVQRSDRVMVHEPEQEAGGVISDR